MNWPAIRPRTTCVYCGKRISGNASDSVYDADPLTRKALRMAARISCNEHARLALDDPHIRVYWWVEAMRNPSPTERAEASGVG